MNPSLILDCSIAVAWLFEDEQTAAVLAVQDRLENVTALTPMHWTLEIVNVLTHAERKRRITNEQATGHLELLASLDIAADSMDQDLAFNVIYHICRRHRLTSYDAAYLELALRTQLPLATLDVDLRNAAELEGIELLGL